MMQSRLQILPPFFVSYIPQSVHLRIHLKDELLLFKCDISIERITVFGIVLRKQDLNSQLAVYSSGIFCFVDFDRLLVCT